MEWLSFVIYHLLFKTYVLLLTELEPLGKIIFAMETYFNISFYTLGGLRLWQDTYVRHGWRVQKNLPFGWFRVLDNHNIRRVCGTEKGCKEALDKYFTDWEIEEKEAEITFLLGGIFTSRASFAKMAKVLAAEGLNPYPISYSVSRCSVKENAAVLAKILAELPKTVFKVNFVTVGMGALVLRETLAMQDKWRNGLVIGRAVMIAPPNHGIAFFKKHSRNIVLKWLAGKALRDAMPTNVAKMSVPQSLDFAVIAVDKSGGAKASRDNDDGIISIKETPLQGMRDFIIFHHSHFKLASATEVIGAVLCFIQTGRLFKSRKIGKIPKTFSMIMEKEDYMSRAAICQSGLITKVLNQK